MASVTIVFKSISRAIEPSGPEPGDADQGLLEE